MSDDSRDTFVLQSQPGVRRDGTSFASEFYTDAQWVRFQRGLPRKMGGYRLMSNLLSAPIRAMHVDSRSTGNSAHCFSPYGVERLTFDDAGIGGGVVARTPVGFAPNQNYTWQADSMFSSGGSGMTQIICAATPDLNSISNDTPGPVYAGDISDTSALVAVEDGSGPIEVSGGCCVLQPFLFVYGSNGLIRNSNPNDFSAGTGWSGGAGLANEANVAGSKIVKGLALRGGGSAPAGLFWALDALIRVSFIRGAVAPGPFWQYDTLSTAISVLSKAAILEYDGVYYWPGVDRFFAFTGVVQELPNDMSLNWFYDNLNQAHRQKIWALKVPRFGEIWWFFPFGEATECTHAIIYNVREKTWYDTRCIRSAGLAAQVFTRPVMAGGESRSTMLLTYTAGTGVFANNNVITGATSGAVGVVVRVTPGQLNVTVTTGAFVDGELISTTGGVDGTITAEPEEQLLDTVWQHEIGTDRVYLQDVTAIEAYVETSNFQYMTGGPVQQQPGGPDIQTRLTRLEPDFVQTGNLELIVKGRSFAQGNEIVSETFVLTPDTQFVNLREQRREMSVRWRSNEAGGNFQQGRVLASIEPGDVRG